MPEITAAAVKALRERTGLPMMDCKKALQEANGDQDAAVEELRKQGIKTKETRVGRETSTGRVAVCVDAAKGVGAIVEFLCESAPVASSDETIRYANDLAKQLAAHASAQTAEQLLALPSLAKPGQTLGEQKDDMFNRIREVFNVGRLARVEGPCGAYAHHDGSVGALVEFSSGSTSGAGAETAREVAMHVVAMKPSVATKADLDPDVVAKEREILSEAARKEGKPENIIDKMIEGRLKNFYAEQVLEEQPFVKDDKRTVGKVAADAGLKIKRFIHWKVGKP